MEVKVASKMVREDRHTGRVVEYNSKSEVVVSLSSSMPPQFGKIYHFITYRETNFVAVMKYHTSTFIDGLVLIPNTTSNTKHIVPLDDISNPLVTAKPASNNKELWILNYH